MSVKSGPFREDGNILIMSVVIVALMVATGMGYMRWAADERWDTAYEEATVQAYFLAQSGVIEKGLIYLRTRKPTELPDGVAFLGGGTIPGVGIYYDTRVVMVPAFYDNNVFQRTDVFDIFSTGRAHFFNHELTSRFYGDKVYVERTAKLRTKLRSFSNYMYLTAFEVTPFQEIIWFWTYDSLYGRTHSNDYIGLKYTPHFFGPVSTSKSEFKEYQANPYFKFEPQFEVPPVLFPKTAQTLRAAANPWIEGRTVEGREMMTRVHMRGEDGVIMYQYPYGSSPPPLYGYSLEDMRVVGRIPHPTWTGTFINGKAEVYGVLAGALTIGTADDMFLVDNIRFITADERNGAFDYKAEANILGLVSEGDIIIQDNFYNGRENGYGRYSANQIDEHSIIIDAGLVALGESFTFEHQNDEFDSYKGPTPDERGIIHLWGAVTQVRRGYVHRSNHIGTGYGKDYHYDFRFDERPPPFYLEALDENGHGLFDIVSWGELSAGQ